MQPCAVFSLSLHCKWHSVCFKQSDVNRKFIFNLPQCLCCLVLSSPPSKLDNSRGVTSGGNGPHVYVEFCQYAGHMSSYVDYRECPAASSSHEGHADICQLFAVSSNPIFIPCKRIYAKFTQNVLIQNLKKTSLVHALLFLTPCFLAVVWLVYKRHPVSVIPRHGPDHPSGRERSEGKQEEEEATTREKRRWGQRGTRGPFHF